MLPGPNVVKALVQTVAGSTIVGTNLHNALNVTMSLVAHMFQRKRNVHWYQSAHLLLNQAKYQFILPIPAHMTTDV